MAAAGDITKSIRAISAVPPPAPTTAVSAEVEKAATARRTISKAYKISPFGTPIYLGFLFRNHWRHDAL